MMSKRVGGFLAPQKAFNEYLPAFSGNHLSCVSLADKNVRKLA